MNRWTEIQSAKCLYRIHRIRQPSTIPLFIYEHHIERFQSIGRYRFDDLGTGQLLFCFSSTQLLFPPQESYERQLERRWDLKVVLLRTQFRLNAPRHFSWSHFVGHWLSPVLAHYPLLLTVLCKFCLPPTDNIVWRERRGERIVDCAEVEIGIELIATLKFRRRLVDPVSLSLV